MSPGSSTPPPGTIELTAGETLTGIYDANCYLVWGESGAVLVDAGSGIHEFAVDVVPEAVLITHAHADHSGGAASMAERGLPLLAHPWTADVLRRGDEEGARLITGRRWNFYPQDYHLTASPSVEDMLPYAQIDLGGATVTALPTPGHSDGHVSFLVQSDQGTAVVGGDLVFEHGAISLQIAPDCRIDRMWQSIQLLRSHNPDALHPGHGRQILTNANHHLDLALQAFELGKLPQLI